VTIEVTERSRRARLIRKTLSPAEERISSMLRAMILVRRTAVISPFESLRGLP